MEATLRVLNDLIEAKLLERYALGGAMAALFYLEPFLTEDLDVFCLVPAPASSLAPFAGVYAALRERGYNFEGEFMMIEGVPVQFLPAATTLEIEAIERAHEQPYGPNLRVPVMRAEYLAAIALQTGRDKDYERVARLLEQTSDLDVGLIRNLVSRHALQARLAIFERRYEEAAKLLPPNSAL